MEQVSNRCIFQKSIEFVTSLLTREREDRLNTVSCLNVSVFIRLSRIFLFRSEDFLTVPLVSKFIRKQGDGSVIP